MFTGIILAIGKISAIETRGGEAKLTIHTGSLALDTTVLGDSIAVNGVCLTAVALGEQSFSADVSNETLSRSILATATVGTPVNLELALTPTTRLGGHLVSGHVDGIGTVLEKKSAASSIVFKFKAPDNLAKYIAEKGSICINGISLTVNQVAGANFWVNIVPHTLQETTLGTAVIGTTVNLEVDLLARYMERLIQADAAADANTNISLDSLQQAGFM